MHDIWNPWHGCTKVSEGCRHCYMYFLDRQRGIDPAKVFRTGAGFTYPLKKRRDGSYVVKSGETLRVCMTSDFFIEEADPWREEAWRIISLRPDVTFYLLTKRPERVAACLPRNWGDGWENIFFNVTCENQKRADERLPLLLELPFRHKGFMAAPLLGAIDASQYLATGQIERVLCGGENYDGARPCHFEWVQDLSRQCREHDVTFCFIETGTKFVKDGRTYTMPDKRLQSVMAFKSKTSYEGKPIQMNLHDSLGLPIPEEVLHKRWYRESCRECGSKMVCNGCSNCGLCD
jgi:protein gp37